jgi:hypothetical protein
MEPIEGSEVLLRYRAQDIDGSLDVAEMSMQVDGTPLVPQRASMVEGYNITDPDQYGATYTFDRAGTYTLDVSVTDGDQNTVRVSVPVVVQANDPPVVTRRSPW